jgi:hypothetical protein
MKRFFLGVLLCAMAYPGAILLMAREHWAVPISVAIAGVFTVAGSLLLALLTLAVFSRRGWLRWWQLMAGGALIGGGLPFLSFQLSGSTVDLETAADIMFVLFTFVLFAGVGAIHALMLWAIAVRGNPWLVVDSAKRPNDA